MSGDVLPLLLACPILAGMIGFELATRTVPLFLTGALGALILGLFLAGLPEAPMLPRIVTAMVVFWFAFALYTARSIDADAVGVVTVMFLYIPAPQIAPFLLVLGGCFAAFFGGFEALRRTEPPMTAGVQTLEATALHRERRELPLTLAIAAAGLLFPWLVLFFDL